jgi:hypothetical protein
LLAGAARNSSYRARRAVRRGGKDGEAHRDPGSSFLGVIFGSEKEDDVEGRVVVIWSSNEV